MSLALNYLKVLLLWLIPINSVVGLGCYGVWRYLSQSWELKASGITIYRWLKTVLVVWALPVLFLPVNIYLQNCKGWGITDGNYFQRFFSIPYIDIIILIVWVIGVVVQFARCMIVWIKDRRVVHRLPKTFHMGWKNDAAKVAAELGIHRKVRLRVGPPNCGPQMVGLAVPIVIIGNRCLKSKERKIVLYHELSHYKHRDLWWQIAMELMVCLNWFNPLCHRLRKNLTMWCETACDAWACRYRKNQFTLKDYGDTVLSFCLRRKKKDKGLARTMGDGMTAEAFIRRIKRLCVSDQIWREKNYRPACCLALIMISVFMLGVGSVYGLGETSNSIAQVKNEDSKTGTAVSFPEAEFELVETDTTEFFNRQSVKVLTSQRHNFYTLQNEEKLSFLIQPEESGDYVITLMGTTEKYEVYICDSEQSVWKADVKGACIIPSYIQKNGLYLRICNTSGEESAVAIGWRMH